MAIRTRRVVLVVFLAFVSLTLLYSSHSHVSPSYSMPGPPPAIATKDLKSDPMLNFNREPIPRRDFTAFAEYKPQNLQDNTTYAFATFYCTRSPDVRDPYFSATQSFIWRMLWSDFHSKYPVIVFVCPFTTPEQRIILKGQGAIVKEVELMDDIVPQDALYLERWQDQFSKLNMWKETDFQRIAYLDSDAFPMKNIDDVFDLVPEQKCKIASMGHDDRKLISKDKSAGENFCNYSFGGVDPIGFGEFTGGFLVLQPNLLMYQRLIRDAKKIHEYDSVRMEQGYLNSPFGFHKDGAFPLTYLPKKYCASAEYYQAIRDDPVLRKQEGEIRVIHSKLWSSLSEKKERPELNIIWDLDWMSMCRFYDDEPFVKARMTGILRTRLDEWVEKFGPGEPEEPEQSAEEPPAAPSEPTSYGFIIP